MPIRYEGLQAQQIVNGNADYINPILQGTQKLEGREKLVKDNINLSDSTYHLGWASAVSFTLKDSQFIDVNLFLNNKDEQIRDELPNDGKIQIVTRGVWTCTAIAIEKGGTYILLHLDEKDLIENNLNRIISTLPKSDTPVNIIASFVNDNKEKDFVNDLAKRLAAQNVRFINRGNYVNNPYYFSHIEFGIFINSERRPTVYFDTYPKNALNFDQIHF